MFDDYIQTSLSIAINAYEKLKNQFLPSSNISHFLQQSLNKLNSYKDNFSLDLAEEILEYIWTLNIFEGYFKYSVPKNYPNEIIIPIQELIQNIYNINPNIYITQQPNLSYHYLPLKFLNDHKSHIFFCLPSNYKNEILFNTILFHEVGHYFDYTYASKHIIFSEMIPYDLVKKYRKINVLNWIKEFFADFFSVKTNNFCSFFSALEGLFSIELSFNNLNIPTDHPTGYLRFKLLSEILKIHHSTFLTNNMYGIKINELITNCEKKYIETFDTDSLLFGYDLLELFRNTILEKIELKVPEILISNSIDQYVNEMINLIPPRLKIEDSYTDALLTGWIVYYFELNNISQKTNIDSNNKTELRNIINNLTRKSITNKYYKKLWEFDEIIA